MNYDRKMFIKHRLSTIREETKEIYLSYKRAGIDPDNETTEGWSLLTIGELLAYIKELKLV